MRPLARWLLLLALPCSSLVAAPASTTKKPTGKPATKTATKPKPKPKTEPKTEPKTAQDLAKGEAATSEGTNSKVSELKTSAPKSSSKVAPKIAPDETLTQKPKAKAGDEDGGIRKPEPASKAKPETKPDSDEPTKTKTAGQGTKSKAKSVAETSKSKSPAKKPAGKATGKGKSKPAPTDDDNEDDQPSSTAKPKPGPESKPKVAAKTKPAVIDNAGDPVAERSRVTGANATISADTLTNFTASPEAVQTLLRLGLALTERELTYRYGSADPSTGGMDCSGTVYYLLRTAGVKDVPRDSSGLYVWARDAGTLRTVSATNLADSQFDALEPGDLLFWEGTYATQRTPPISHTMIYLGREKETGQRVMVGASDGRSYRGIRRNGVSVFDFKLPKAESTAKFVGYARVPGL